MLVSNVVNSMKKFVCFFIFCLYLTRIHSQDCIDSIQFDDCSNVTVDFDSIKSSLTDSSSITIILLRAEHSYDKSAIIGPLDKKVFCNSNDVFIKSYELKYCQNSLNCEFSIIVKGKKIKTKVLPARFWIISKNKQIIECLRKDKKLGLSYYNYDKSFLFPDIIRNSEDTYCQLNEIIKSFNNIRFTCLFNRDSDTKETLTSFLRSIDSLNSALIELKESLIDLNSKIDPSDSSLKNSIDLFYSCPYSLNYDNSQNYFAGMNFSKQIFKNRFFCIGLGLGISYQNYNFSLSDAGFDETIPKIFVDYEGNVYNKIVNVDRVSEKINMESISLLPSIFFSTKDIPLFSSKIFLSFKLSPSLKITNNISSTYNTSVNSISYSGYFTSNSTNFKNDTTIIDDIRRGLYSNLMVENEDQLLKIKQTYLSLYLPLDLKISYNKRFGISFGIFYEYSYKSILQNNSSDAFFSYEYGSYNSLSYRSRIEIKLIGFKISLFHNF
jgi:hypothetical protein